MSDVAIQVDHVWKKFRKGEMHDSLREMIPAMCRNIFKRGKKQDELRGKEFWALRDVSFEVKRGQSMGIIGPNGAGKSTMLKLLSRIIKPNRGSYRVNGRLSSLIEVGAGFHGDLTGRENIYLNGTILGMVKKEIQAKEEQIIDFAGVESFIDTPVKHYSSGMTARLGFSVAAHLDPEVLLVDEVLSVGDAKFRTKCVNHMHKLLKSGITVVFISHLLDQVRSLCPQTVVLDKGAVIYQGATDGAIRTYLDALGDAPKSTEAGGKCEAEIRNVKLIDAGGNETQAWTAKQPATIGCDLVLHGRVESPSVQIVFSTLTGTYLFTVNSDRYNLSLPNEPGSYPIRFTLDPMPLADGDYQMEFKIFGEESSRCIWVSRQGRAIGVQGGNDLGSLISAKGYWTVSGSQQTRSKPLSPVVQ